MKLKKSLLFFFVFGGFQSIFLNNITFNKIAGRKVGPILHKNRPPTKKTSVGRQWWIKIKTMGEKNFIFKSGIIILGSFWVTRSIIRIMFIPQSFIDEEAMGIFMGKSYPEQGSFEALLGIDKKNFLLDNHFESLLQDATPNG